MRVMEGVARHATAGDAFRFRAVTRMAAQAIFSVWHGHVMTAFGLLYLMASHAFLRAVRGMVKLGFAKPILVDGHFFNAPRHAVVFFVGRYFMAIGATVFFQGGGVAQFVFGRLGA